MFPDARFVHVVRDPYMILPSTMHVWKRLYRDQGVQTPLYDGLEEYVLRTFVEMYEAFERDRALIAPGRLSEVRYEDLVADIPGEMRRIYGDLELDGFDDCLPLIEKYAEEQAGYQRNSYELAAEARVQVTRRWDGYIRKYGYARPAVEASHPREVSAGA
jgi:hypothetical protein